MLLRYALHALVCKRREQILFRPTVFLADRTNGRAYATVLRLSSVRLSVVVCDVMYCG